MFSLKKKINMSMIQHVKKNNIFEQAKSKIKKRIKNVNAPNVSKMKTILLNSVSTAC